MFTLEEQFHTNTAVLVSENGSHTLLLCVWLSAPLLAAVLAGLCFWEGVLPTCPSVHQVDPVSL